MKKAQNRRAQSTVEIEGNKFHFPQWYFGEHGGKAKTSFWLAPIYYPDTYEKQERDLVKKHFDGSERVLEVGCYVGVVSCLINNIIKDKEAHIAIELLDRYAGLLEENRKTNNCKFKVICGQIINPSPRIHRDWYKLGKTIKLDDFNKEINFNTLVMDCEGAEFDFIDQYPEFVKSMEKLLIEWHRVNNSDRNAIRRQYVNRLKNMGFKLIESQENVDFLNK